MAHWVRRARWIVAAAGAGFLLLVVVSLRERDPPASSAPIVSSDPSAEIEVTGATARQWSGADERFSVAFDRQFGYADGRQRFEGLTVTVDDREGNRQFVATALTGEASPSGDAISLTGEVRLVSSDGLVVETAEASHQMSDRVVRIPGPATFNLGRLRGSGVGMTLDRGGDLLSVHDQATLSVAPDEAGTGEVEASARTATLARRDGYVRFQDEAVILRDGRRMSADVAVGHLSEDESFLTGLELQGHSRIEIDGAAAGALETMEARDINLGYSDDGARIENAVLAGDAVIEFSGEAGGVGRSVAAGLLNVGLDTDGATVRSLDGREGVRLEFPADAGAPARTILASSLDGGDEGQGALTRARLTGEVEYRESIRPPAAARVVRARELDLGFSPGLAGITEARFTGEVHLEEGDLSASARTADYDLAIGLIDLRGGPGAVPWVADAGFRVDADHILLTIEGPRVVASGTVRSVLRAPPGEGDESVRMPGFLTGDLPVNVTGVDLDYDGAASRATYRGGARLFQGDSVVVGETIVIDTEAGNLTATGSAGSTLPVRDENEGDGGTLVMTIASADALDYREDLRRLTYTGRAHVDGPQGDLLGRQIELYLRDDNTLERVEAYDEVELRESGRVATGARLSFTAEDRKYVMSGTPARFVGDCSESTGPVLTFYRSADQILIDGQQTSRTRVTSENDCTEPSRGDRSGTGR